MATAAPVGIKDILVALSPRGHADPARDYALSMARACGAHVTGAAYAIAPDIPGSMFPAFAQGLAQKARDGAEASAAAARAAFEAAATAAGISHEFRGASASANAAVADFAAAMRTCDLGVITQHTEELARYGDMFEEAALFRSGRPTIVVPTNHASGFSKQRVLIAWDGGVHAARAVAGAMPLLAGADVEVLTVAESAKGADLRGEALVVHLRRHRLNAGLRERQESDVAQAILREVELVRPSLVVMGAYGQSRLREFIFGGATRAMLRAMTTPVLMAH